ncbi:MAG: NUDIX domain-containing protein [Patescibacteria group bacterium]|nr:NUDIX domain-containing protein [Patescibacteria group bacterium]
MASERKQKYIYCPNCKNTLEKKLIDQQNVLFCNNCKFTFWKNPKPVTSIIIEKDKKILMLQRSSEPFMNYWVLPGGFMGYEETAEQSIIREAKEETGLDIIIKGISGVYRINNDPRGIHIDIIYHGIPEGEVKLSKEDKNWHYFVPSHLPDKIAYCHREAIMDWYKKGGQYKKI